MSLHTLANHLQSAGRGEDKVLVHMTPGEVNGLQSLAMAHGGSLTINPDTGLPEAGILKSLLPMIAGFALGPAGLGMTAMQAGLTTAAVGAAATGSLGKGLMMGMGAYSGAGLGAGLQSMAAPAAAPAVPGLSPTVAANASTLGGTAPLSNVGAENLLTNADDLLMQGAKSAPVGGFNPSDSVVFVKNAPVPAVTPANAADFMNQTNQSILGKLPNAGNLPVAGAKPAPFVENFPSGDSVVPLEPRAVPVRSSGSYYDSTFKEITPVERSGFGIRGGAAQQGKPIAQQIYGGPDVKPDYSYVDKGLQGPNARGVGIRTIDAEPPIDVKTVDLMPADATVTRGLSGSPPAGMGPYDKSIMSNVAPRGETVIAKDLPPIESRTGPVNFRKSEIIVDPTMTEPASITQYTRPFTDRMAELGRGAKASFGSLEGLKGLYAASEAAAPYGTYAGLGSTAYSMYEEKRQRMEDEARARAEANRGLIRPYTFDYGAGSGENVSAQPYYGSAERTYFRPTYTELPSYKAPGPEYAAKGGLMGLAAGGPVEEMAAMNAVGANTGYPMAALQTPMYSNPAMQRPEATNVVAPSADYGVGAYSGEPRFAKGGTAEPESSGYTYDYNPSTMQFTQTGGPGFSKTPTGEELAQGVAAHDMLKRFNEHILTGNPYNSTPSFMAGTAPNGTVSGGIATPMVQPTTVGQPFAPTTVVPAYQTPEQQLGLGGFYDMMNQRLGGYGGYAAGGGVSHLGDYSDGGRLLKGPGDGVSDSIPASIGNRQPARLADGEFVVPARIVSEIGNGSTEAGARKLYAMMERVQKARRKTTGKNQVARNTKAERLLPA